MDENLLHKIIMESIDEILVNEGFLGGLSALNRGFQERQHNKASVITLPSPKNKEKNKLSLNRFKPSSDRIIDMLFMINGKIEGSKPNINKLGNTVKQIGTSIKNKDYKGLYDRYSKFANDVMTDYDYDEPSDDSQIDDDEYMKFFK